MEKQVEALLRGGQFRQILDNYLKGMKKDYGLKRTEIEMLYYLSRCGERNSPRDVTQFLHMNKGHISQTADSLCRKGYISSSRDTGDYRVLHYTITEDARLITEEIDAAIDRLYAAMLEGISDEDQETLKRIAAQIAANISRILPE